MMIDAPATSPEPRVVRECAARGVRVSVDGDELAIEPASMATPDLLARIRAHKSEIIAFLTAQAPSDPSPPPVAPPTIDDPALWAEPEPDGLADGLFTLIADVDDTARRIVQGEQVIADRRTLGQAVPATWTIRLRNLTTRRAALAEQLAERVPRTVAAANVLAAWLDDRDRRLGALPADDPALAARDDTWLRVLARYERLCDAVHAAPAIVATPPASDDDLASVSWVRAWDDLRRLGFADKRQVQTAIGGWDADPRVVVERARAAARRRTTPSEPPLVTVAATKDLMNRIAHEEGLPVPFDDAGFPILHPRIARRR